MRFPLKRGVLLDFVLGFVTLLLLALAWKYDALGDGVRALIAYIPSLGFWGPLFFLLVYLVVATIGMPRSLLNIGAGALFSFPEALGVILMANMCVFSATFSIARHFARDWVNRKLMDWPVAHRLQRSVERDGFKVVFLTQVNPLIPAFIKGYAFGATNVNFLTYLKASVLGFLPMACVYVYMGWVGGTAVLHSGDAPLTWRAWTLIGGGIVLVLAVALLSRFAHVSLHRHITAD